MMAIARALIKKQGPFLATRADPSVARAIRRLDRRAQYYPDARIVAIHPPGRNYTGIYSWSQRELRTCPWRKKPV